MTFPAARMTDDTAHKEGRIVMGCPTVLIAGLPAARVGDMHVCGIPNHVGGPIITGSATVLIGGQPAAYLGSLCKCLIPPIDIVRKGETSVLIGP